MELGTRDVDRGDFACGDLGSDGVAAAVETTGDLESLGRSRPCDEADDGFVVFEGFAAPVRRDEREEAVFDLVPFA